MTLHALQAVRDVLNAATASAAGAVGSALQSVAGAADQAISTLPPEARDVLQAAGKVCICVRSSSVHCTVSCTAPICLFRQAVHSKVRAVLLQGSPLHVCRASRQLPPLLWRILLPQASSLAQWPCRSSPPGTRTALLALQARSALSR